MKIRAGYRFIRQSILSPAGRGTYFLRPFQLACASMETAQCGLSGAERDNQGGIVVKSQRPTQAKNALELSRAIIARHYLDLQRLRDEVRKAEISRGVHALRPTKITLSAPHDRIENR